MYAFLRPYSSETYRVAAVRRTLAALSALKTRRLGDLVVELRNGVKLGALLSDRGYRGIEGVARHVLVIGPGDLKGALSESNPRRVRTNPPLEVMSREVVEIRYIHAKDGLAYCHKFAPGVTMYAEGDKVIRLERPDGRALSQRF